MAKFNSTFLLYDYYRSSASYRVRIALGLKNLPVDYQSIHLVNNGGEQHHPSYQDKNPQHLVPTLEHQGQLFSQSLAIIEYLDEQYPNPPLLPEDAVNRAHVRAIAQMISCDIHPLNNLRVLQYLKKNFQADEEAVNSWYQHWVVQGFDAIEHLISKDNVFCVGNTISVADICLIPQVYNAKRFLIDLSPYPKIEAINERCLEIPAFIAAAP
jgi:maleylacetoacetate isomerase